MKYFFLFLIFCWLFVLETIPVWAQKFSLSIYPPLLEVMIQPGRSITQVYKIRNNGEDLIIIPQIISFKVADEAGNIKLINQQPNRTEKQWFSLTNSNRNLGQPFSLSSGKTEELVLKIKIPKNAPEKDHYFSFVLSTPPTPPGTNTKTKTRGAIASNILLTISKDGKPRRLAEIAEFKTKKIIDSFDQPVFTVKIKNVGPALFKPQGNIVIKNIFGQTTDKLNLLPENVLAYSVRQIRCQNSAHGQSCLLDSKFLIGRYQARLNFEVDGKNYQKTIIFWALPIKLVSGLVIIFSLLLVIRKRLNWLLTKPKK